MRRAMHENLLRAYEFLRWEMCRQKPWMSQDYSDTDEHGCLARLSYTARP